MAKFKSSAIYCGVVEAVQTQAFDVVVIGGGPAGMAAALAAQKAGARVAIVIGQGSKFWPASGALDFADLLHEQWVMPPSGTLTRIQMDAFLIERGASWLRPRAETASLAMMQALLHKGDYVGVCSESMAAYQAQLGLLRQIAVDSSIRFGPITVMWKREHATPTLMDFVACLEQSARATEH